jgi:phosphoserine phosphatase
VCEIFAAHLGKLDAMQQFEKLESLEELAAARLEMLGWYSAASRSTLLELLAEAPLAPRTHEGIALLREHRVECAIASITWRFAVEWFATLLGVRHFLGTGLDDSDAIVHVWPEDKGRWVGDLARSLGVPKQRVAAVGDSWRDVPMLEAASLRFYVGGSQGRVPEGAELVPDGDIERIARAVTETWELGS